MARNIKIKACKVCFREREEKRPPGTPGRRWEANIKMDHGEICVKQKCGLYT
jgi:hypothetical protein